MTYKPEESRKLGTALRELLKQRGLSERQFAKRCDLEPDYMSKLLNGEIDQPRQEKLTRLARGLELSVKSFDELYQEIQRLISTQLLPSPSSIPPVSSGIDQVVQQVRSRLLPLITAPDSAIGTMRMLGVNHSVLVEEIYVDLNVLKELSCSLLLSDWEGYRATADSCESFDRLGLSPVERKRVNALSTVQDKDYSKLMVVGKPGAGKTTFLKSLAVTCIQSEKEFFTDRVPIFVTLREFAREASEAQSWKLIDYIVQVLAEQWQVCDYETATEILQQGRSLVLLDGLDEVRPQDLESVLRSVTDLGLRSNRLVITCRTQAQRQLNGFRDVEVADFTPQQADRFITNWFQALGSDSQASIALELQKQLRVGENKFIAELAVTPVLLSLICSVFQNQGNLPEQRFQLYERAMRQLLERKMELGLERSLIDENLTFDVKEKFLAELAFMLFQRNDYIPEEKTIEKLIKSYFAVEGSDARKILRIFETETGLLVERSAGYWSFSHLTFHEYFTALKILEYSGELTSSEIKTLLERHILDEDWREVFALIAEKKSNESR